MYFAAHNVDKILIAFWLGGTRPGQAALGMYSQAFNLMMKPVHLVCTPVTGIVLPVLSRLMNDRDQYAQVARHFYRMVGIVLLPCGIGLGVVGGDVMVSLGGPTWAPAGWMITALAPVILVQGFVSISGSLFASVGRPDRLLVAGTVTALVVAGGTMIGFAVGDHGMRATWGPVLGVAWGYSIATVLIVFVPHMVFCCRTTGLSFGLVFGPLRRPLAAALMMGVLTGAVRFSLVGTSLATPLRLLTTVAVGMVFYLTVARTDIRWLVAQLAGSPAAKT